MWLMVCRFLCFLAIGGMEPVLQRLISSYAGQEKRGQVFGVMQGFSVGGVMLSALISGGVIYIAGVRGVVLTGGILFIICAIPAFALLKKAEAEKKS